ncbi:MAG: TDP-N-acetylfucosamine:lipid II N-acetylfucosaminyltransferase [Pseudomonadota bacterium]
MPLLHLCLDEKFVDFARGVYEAAYPGANLWYVYRSRGGNLSQVTPAAGVQVIDDAWLASREARRAINTADGLVIHFLDPAFYSLLRDSEPGFAVWHSWGEDLYPLLRAAMPPLYLPATSRLMTRLRVRHLLNPGRLLARLANQRRPGGLDNPMTMEVLGKLDRVSMTPREFTLFQHCWPDLKATFQYFHYYSVEDSFEPGPERMAGPDILLGNSASGSNNHIEALETLAALDLGDRRVYCPLSYGDAVYARAVIRHGHRLLGKNFCPLTDFLPLADYYAILGRCGFVLMNHVRQQAVGTIGAALYKGASVFLRPENPALDYFRETGACLFELDELNLTNSLTETQVQHNRRCLADRYAFDRVVDCVRGYPVVTN